jgi:hypothetical protein
MPEVNWPGQPAAPAWPGTPAKPAAQATQWPGEPVRQDAAPQSRALPWETAKPGQQQATWGEIPAAIGTAGKEMLQGLYSAMKLPGDVWQAGMKGEENPIDTPEGQERAFGLASMITPGGKFPGPKTSIAPAVIEVKKLLSPQSVSPIAGEAAGELRRAGGIAARDTASTAAALEEYRPIVNAMPDADRLAFINHVEGGSSKELNLSGNETVRTAASKIGDKVYEGSNHLDAIKKAADERGEDVMQTLNLFNEGKASDGWITSAGRFVDRDEATRIATKSGQRKDLPAGSRKASEGLGHNELGKNNIQELADTLKAEFQKRRAKIEAMPGKEQMDFVEDYYPHHWQDPKSASAVVNEFRGAGGKQGSGASLKKRSIPTIADGIAAGLKPLTTDPIEATMRYVSSMDKFIASQGVLDAAKANGTVRYFRPKTMGASGHPASGGSNVAPSGPIPEGWVPIKGRGATNAMGQTAYAPEDWARVYNNYISRGFHEMDETLGNSVDAFQRASNSVTGLELGLSGYHAFTMANEAVISDVARAVSNAAGGKPIKGLKALITAPVSPIRGAIQGKKMEQVYLGRSQGSPDMRRIVNLMTEAGGRGVGKGHASDYGFSAAGSYFTAWKRGALKQEMRQSLQNIKDRPIVGTVKEIGKIVGRTMETVSQPLFEKYIPRLKNSAFYDTMKDWLEANPNASHEQQVAMARKLVDSIDDRFGELIQDNVFWNKAMKQTAQIAMRSYSWNFGTARTIGGGALSALRNPKRLSISHPEHDPRVAYVVALAVTVPLMNMVYQYLKSGKHPESVDDAMAGRTGGTAPGFGGRGEVEERAMLPGYQKDVFGWYNDPKQEALNKQSRMLEIIEETISGKDWQGHPFVDPDAEIEQQLAQYLQHVAESLVPISVQTLGQGRKTGSALGVSSELMGIRPAPGWMQDPEGTKAGLQKIHSRAYKQGQKSERRQQSQYGGPAEHE